MKIRIESNSFNSRQVSGVGYYSKLLAESLAESTLNNDVRLFSFDFLGRQPITNLKNTKNEITNWFPLKVYAKLVSYGLPIPFDASLNKVDLTIFPNFSKWPTIKSKVVATVVHDLTYLYYPELVDSKNLAHLKRVVPRAMKKSDFIITVSEAVKAELVKEFGTDPQKIIATPIPPSDTFSVMSTQEIHIKYNIPTEKYIFFIGNLEPRKNIPVLVEAYEKLPKDITDEYSLVISGGRGWKTEKSQAAIDHAKAQGLSVIQTGYIDEEDKSALYQKASLFVMPSLYEGFGMPVVEAAASKTPVIAADIPVLREAGASGALYFEPTNSAELADKINTVLTDEKLQVELTNNATEHLASISWSANAQRILDHAQSIIDTKSTT